MRRTGRLLFVIFMVSSLSWAQNGDSISKNWRLNEQGKLQYSVNERVEWKSAECNAEARLNAFHFVSPENGWAVGHNATVVRWDGEKWSEVLIFSTADLLSLFFQDADTGWAVGTQGTIMFWDGTSWNAEQSPTTETLTEIKRLANGMLQITSLTGITLERINGQWLMPVTPVLSASINHPEK